MGKFFGLLLMTALFSLSAFGASEGCGQDKTCLSIQKSVSSRNCDGDAICESLRMAMDETKTLDDCKWHAPHPMWCYTVKRALYDDSCNASYNDQWTVPEMCRGVKAAYFNRKCDWWDTDCQLFVRAGFGKR
jgi:hypothetical protein